MHHVDEEESLEKRSSVMEALMVGDQAMRDYAKFMAQVMEFEDRNIDM